MAQKDEFAEDIQSLKLRSYQAEVLEKCLQKNVIVASPTGSEKRLLGREDGTISLTISSQAARLTLLSLASKLNWSTPSRTRCVSIHTAFCSEVD
jgi:hypothetical protein